jgi:hypothetical protein
VRPFHSPSRPARFRRSLLSLESLEGREVPAGTVTAFVTPLGVLTILGDDNANGVSIAMSAAGIATLTPDATTTINGPAVVPGTVKSIKADFKGGDDTVSIHPTDGFKVTGTTAITLGDGNNTLDLVTTGVLDLAALTVKGGDGTDALTIQGGANSVINKAATFSFLNGGSTTTLTDIRFGLGVNLKAGDAIGNPNSVSGTNVQVARVFTANMGNSVPGTVDFVGSTLGGLALTGFSTQGILDTTTVNGGITMRGVFQTDLQVDGVTVTRSVTLIAPNPNFEAADAGTIINGNLTLTGTAGWTNVSFLTDTPSEVRGNVTVKGGWFSDSFVADSDFKVGKNLSLTLAGGDNLVSIGDGTAAVAIGGNMAIRGGAGIDTISLNRVTLTGTVPLRGNTIIQTFAGADTLSIEDGSSFIRLFTADLGTGDDTISLAQNLLAPGPVPFTGNAKILAGKGNDSLFLGLDAAAGGDANSRVSFLGLRNTVDGGDGIDFFDDTTDQAAGVTPIGWE